LAKALKLIEELMTLLSYEMSLNSSTIQATATSSASSQSSSATTASSTSTLNALA
jgi:xanthine dehydrogenase molybdopterin-binding subunit B